MRTGLRTFLTLAVVSAVALSAGCAAESHPRPPKPPKPPKVSRKVQPAPEAHDGIVVLKVQGPHKVNRDEARQEALELAHVELVDHLRVKFPGVKWEPSEQFLNRVLHQESVDEMRQRLDRVQLPDDVETLYGYNLELHLRPEDYKALLKEQRVEGSKGRMLWLGKILLGAVVLLLGVSSYVRVDDLTKGYLTRWLRVGMIALVIVLLVGALMVVV